MSCHSWPSVEWQRGGWSRALWIHVKCSFPRLVVTSVFLFMIARFPYHLQVIRVFPGSSAGKESACNAGDPCLIPGSGRFPWRKDGLPTPLFLGFLDGSDGKESACNVGDLGSIPGLGRSLGGGYGNPLQYSCLENHHGQRSLVDYSSWGHRVRLYWVTKHSTHERSAHFYMKTVQV